MAGRQYSDDLPSEATGRVASKAKGVAAGLPERDAAGGPGAGADRRGRVAAARDAAARIKAGRETTS